MREHSALPERLSKPGARDLGTFTDAFFSRFVHLGVYKKRKTYLLTGVTGSSSSRRDAGERSTHLFEDDGTCVELLTFV